MRCKILPLSIEKCSTLHFRVVTRILQYGGGSVCFDMKTFQRSRNKSFHEEIKCNQEKLWCVLTAY